MYVKNIVTYSDFLEICVYAQQNGKKGISTVLGTWEFHFLHFGSQKCEYQENMKGLTNPVKQVTIYPVTKKALSL